MTIAIASLLDLDQAPESKKVWDLMLERCNHMGLLPVPIPHFSWQVAGNYALDQLLPAIESLALTWREFSVRTSGLGLFSGETPVLYLPIIKTRELLEKHDELWDLCSGFAVDLSLHYSPQNWMPHITIIHQKFSFENVSCVIKDLYQKDLGMEFRVQKVEIIYQNDDEEGIKAEFSLQKG